MVVLILGYQCWTEGRSSTAVAEDLRPTAMATVAEVSGHSYTVIQDENYATEIIGDLR